MIMADTEFDDTTETIEIEQDVPETVSDENFAVADTVSDEDFAVADTEETAEDDGDDEVVVSIGEEAPPPQEETRAPEWVRELRKANREKDRRIRELEAKLNTSETETKPVVLGPKPTLEACDYDSDDFEQKLADWYEQKRAVDAAEAQQREAQEAEAVAWQKKLEGYEKAKASLRVRDYEDAEATALETFSVTQQGIVIQGSENPALLVYAVGKNPSKAKELASITDPVKFAFAVAKLETQLKVTNRKAAASPERTITSGGGRLSGAIDSTLERLRAEAEKTGDYTKVLQYKRQKQAAS
jgi:hypothetical protein